VSAEVIDAQPNIAVLPLENLSDDPELQYFSSTLTTEIWNQLARIEGLKVISMRSSSLFGDAKMDVREIGSRLSAGTWSMAVSTVQAIGRGSTCT